MDAVPDSAPAKEGYGARARLMRVALLDNDPGYRSALAGALEAEGTICEEFAQLDLLLERVKRRRRYDLVFVDRRLLDDREEGDTSGEGAAAVLSARGMRVVLISSYLVLHGDHIFDMLRNGVVAGVVSKATPVLEIVECTKHARDPRRFPNCLAEFKLRDELGIEFQGVEVWRRLAMAAGRAEDDWGLEFSALLRSLVPSCAVAVALELVSQGHSGAAMLRARVSCGDALVTEEIALKYGSRKAIHDEMLRYDRFAGPLPDGVAAHLRWRAETINLGAIAYAWVGNSLESGTPLGPVCEAGAGTGDLSWPSRRDAIRKLFAVSLNPWFDIYRRASAGRSSDSLWSHYSAPRSGAETEPCLAQWQASSLIDNLDKLFRQENGTWLFEVVGAQLPDPLRWLRDTENDRRYQVGPRCPCHGDLHVANVFVLPDGSPRLIDFGATGLGHVFRDFASLEVSIRLTSVRHATDGRIDEQIRRVAQMEDKIAAAKNLADYIVHRDLDARGLDGDAGMVIQSTTDIRRAALEAISCSHAHGTYGQYLVAVAAIMLRYASGKADEIKGEAGDAAGSQRHAFLRVWQALYAAAKAAKTACELALDD